MANTALSLAVYCLFLFLWAAVPVLVIVGMALAPVWTLAALAAHYAVFFATREGPWPLWRGSWAPWVRGHLAEAVGGNRVTAEDDTLLTERKGGLLFACHPHGQFTQGFASNITCHPQTAYVRPAISKMLLYAPVYCFWLRGLGFRAVDGASLKGMMTRGESVALLPGGFEEAVATAPGRQRVFLAQRRGFVKYALQHGYSLVPVYTFGENELYSAMTAFESLRVWLAATAKLPIIAFWGPNPLMPFLPHRGGMHTVFGQPIALPKIARPTREEVAKHHGEYVDALRALFDKHKPSGEMELVVV